MLPSLGWYRPANNIASTDFPEPMLPVALPDIADYAPVSFDPDDPDSEPSPPLNKADDWVHVDLDLGDGLRPYTRDTNVMPQWAGSSSRRWQAAHSTLQRA